MNTVKTFFAGMLAMLLLAVVGYAAWIIIAGSRFPNANLVNSVPDPRSVVIDTSAPPTVVFTQPQFVTATPPAPPVVVMEPPTTAAAATAAPPTQQPESVIDYADDVLVQPTRDYQLTDDQLASCIAAQVEQRRLAPYCPPNPAEYAGPGR